jgi:hypothetical protein
MYDLYEYISECAIAAALSTVIYMYRSSCSVALTVRLTVAERAKTYLPSRCVPHISELLVTSALDFPISLPDFIVKRQMRTRAVHPPPPAPFSTLSHVIATAYHIFAHTHHNGTRDKYQHGAGIAVRVTNRPFSCSSSIGYRNPPIQAARAHSPRSVWSHLTLQQTRLI